MNDLIALNEAYDSLAASRMETHQVIGELTIDAHDHIFLKRPKGTISIDGYGHSIKLRAGRSIEFECERSHLSIRFEDGSGDLINGELIPYPKKGVLHVTLTLMDDLDGPILDIR